MFSVNFSFKKFNVFLFFFYYNGTLDDELITQDHSFITTGLGWDRAGHDEVGYGRTSHVGLGEVVETSG